MRPVSESPLVLPVPVEARFEPLREDQIAAVLQVEQRVHPHPWTAVHFLDVLKSGYQAQLLMGADQVLGYFVAMKGVDEVHLLNISVAPEQQRQGWARVMLDALAVWARGQQVQWIWLEARLGNARALQVYEAHGFRRVGVRKDYYPGQPGQREDAVVMSLAL